MHQNFIKKKNFYGYYENMTHHFKNIIDRDGF